MLSVPDLRSDGHVHTRYCNHACGSMEAYVQAAIDRNLRSLTFLEHLEVGIRSIPRTWLNSRDFEEYFREGERLRIRYGDRITIRLGVEAGFNPYAAEDLQTALRQFPWDRVGLSYHFYRVGSHHCNLVSRRQENLLQLAAVGTDRVISDYFDGLLAALDCISCDVVCHLDAVLRHYPNLHLTSRHHQQVDTLLAAMARRGIALEINTSGYPIRNQPFPGPGILGRAMALGIPLVPGSDAHRPADVGRFFDRLPTYLDLVRKTR